LARKISQDKGTKNEMIVNMLLDNNNKYSAREIARAVGTTEGNVFKEKSRLKATGILTDQRLSLF
jgi:biotin operon repressor